MLVRLVISASIEALSSNDPNWSLVIAPVALGARASLLSIIFSKVLPRHDKREIGQRFWSCEVSARPGFGIGTHFAAFHGLETLSTSVGGKKGQGDTMGGPVVLLEPFCKRRCRLLSLSGVWWFELPV